MRYLKQSIADNVLLARQLTRDQIRDNYLHLSWILLNTA